MSEFLMPSLGADMEAGKLVEWLIKPGEHVDRGDIIAVVETQKGAIEVETFMEGVLEKYLVDIGKKVPVGTPLAIIKQAGEKKRSAEQPEPSSEPVETTLQKADILTLEPAAPEKERPVSDERILVTPAARRLAEVSGLNLKKYTNQGSGPDGAITLTDIEEIIGKEHDEDKTARPTAADMEASGMRGAIAAAMSRSKKEIPHYYLAHEIDLSTAMNFIASVNKDRPPSDRLLLGALYLRAVAMALGKFPEFNGYFKDEKFQKSDAIHIGMAIRIKGGGLVAPAIHDAQDLDLDNAMSSMRDLVSRARMGRFRSSEMSDSTITISSLGDRGVETLYGVIYPPQVAIIGFGTPTTRPWIDNEAVVARQVVTATLSADHRVSDGHRGALFLNAIDNFLQRPEIL